MVQAYTLFYKVGSTPAVSEILYDRRQQFPGNCRFPYNITSTGSELKRVRKRLFFKISKYFVSIMLKLLVREKSIMHAFLSQMHL